MTAERSPTCRATIRGATVTLNRCRARMGTRGPQSAGMQHVDVALADLFKDTDELIVRPVRDTRWTARAERTLLTWAQTVGYRRVWLPERVVTFDDVLAPVGRAQVTCPTCHAQWHDDTMEFWSGVRDSGWFPGSCLACGGSLPEWRLAGATAGHVDAPEGGRAAGGRRPGAAARRSIPR